MSTLSSEGTFTHSDVNTHQRLALLKSGKLESMMNHAAVADLLENSAGSLKLAVERIHDPSWTATPASGGWCAAQVLEHLTMTERSVGGLLKRLSLRGTKDQPAVTLLSDEDVYSRMVTIRAAALSPDHLVPSASAEARPAQTMLADFLSHRNETLEFAKSQEFSSLRTFVFRHPGLGPLDGVQWLIFLAGHTERHVKQMKTAIVALTV